MNTQNALPSVSSNGLGWQIDIPGLTSLALRLGAAGLKQLAMEGVDIHVIGCMWKIAEICPASNDYRREISHCRQEQRSQSIWFYKIVEVGSATNFVVDELLKNRAGENVVALLSTIIPVMTDKASDTLLLQLFESSRVPHESTPSFSQLRSIRVALEPLARKMSFHDKVFQYHQWMKTLLGPSARMTSAYESIPSAETAVFVIKVLGRLVMGDPNCLVAYYGLKGAAWVASYARYFLGLPVCIMRSTSDSIPLSGNHKSSRVRLYIYDTQNRCEIQVEDKLDQFIIAESLSSHDRKGWTIDTARVNLLKFYFPDSLKIRSSISSFIDSLVQEYTEVIAKAVNPFSEDDVLLAKSKIVRYPLYYLPSIRQRARRILGRFGLEICNGRELTT